MPTRLLLVLAVTLAACDPDGASRPPAASLDPRPVSIPDTSMIRDVSAESTLQILSGDLAQASPSAAIQTVDLWIARLDTVSAEGVPALRDDLTTLRNLLQSSPLDGPAIGRTMRSLGDQTVDLADAGTPLASLGRALRTQGDRLAPDPTRGAEGADVR